MRKLGSIAVCALLLLAIAAPASWAGVAIGVSVGFGPPPIPVYAQPICPGPGYLWTPGYWAYGAAGYYWVPGTWVMAPSVGVLWTPGYWGWGGGGYLWHAGYWGPHVGFYGGINYGFGYGGVGFVGGRWDHGVFAYNTAVMHVDTRIVHTTFVDRTVIRNENVSRVSFNGGRGGLNVRASAQEESAMHERHIFATSEQSHHEEMARNNRAFLASENHGRPEVAATSRPGEFNGHAAMGRGGDNHGGDNHGGDNHGMDNHRMDNHSMGNPRGVPRPPSQEAHTQSMGMHGNGGMQHNAPRPESQPRANGGGEHQGGGRQGGSQRQGAAEHHDNGGHQGGEHHDGGGRPR